MKFKSDIVYDFVEKNYDNYNDLGDAVALLNVGILFFALPHLAKYYTTRILSLFIFLMIFREVVSVVTFCESHVNKEYRPLFGGDSRLYTISGHLVSNMLITSAVCESQIPLIVKFTSILLTFCIFFVQIVTREHYSKDMLITSLLCFFALKSCV